MNDKLKWSISNEIKETDNYRIGLKRLNFIDNKRDCVQYLVYSVRDHRSNVEDIVNVKNARLRDLGNISGSHGKVNISQTIPIGEYFYEMFSYYDIFTCSNVLMNRCYAIKFAQEGKVGN